MWTTHPETLEFIRKLPKTETHLHIEGALPWELLLKLDRAKYAQTPGSWAKDFRFDSFEHFERELLGYALAWYTTPERYHEAARIVFQQHLARNVRYVEISFASGVVEFLGVPGPEIAEAIKAAVPKGLEVRVFMGIHRNGCGPQMRPIIESCLGWKHLDGIDLHGVEVLPLEDWSRELWPEARRSGKFTKAHAGEFGGPSSVRQVVNELGVRRVEHGVRAAECAETLRFLAAERVVFDVCPISNVKLRVASDMARHPIRRLIEAGVRCTVSTDDPISFGNTIDDDYAALASELKFSRKELADVARTGFEIALMPDDAKRPLLAEIDRAVSAYTLGRS